MKKWMYGLLIISLILALGLLPGCGKKDTPQPSPQTDKPTTAPSSPPVNYKQWDNPPEMTINQEKIYLATIKTQIGDIKFQLMAEDAPKTVNNFVFLVNEDFYNSSSFYYVEEDVMAIGGKPGNGVYNGPGYSISDEITEDMRFDGSGYVAMVKTQEPDTAGSQFFITKGKTPWFTGRYTIFGKVTEGMDIVNKLTGDDKANNQKGTGIYSIEVSELKESLLPEKTTWVPNRPVPEEGRPLAELSLQEREFIYDAAPAMVINPKKSYTAIFNTTQGTIDVKLRPDIDADSVNNFVVLARLGYYDNFPFMNFMAHRFLLTGSPEGLQRSDIGYNLPKKYSPELPWGVGKLCFWQSAKQDFSSSGSIIFFMLTNDPRGDYGNVFGEVSQKGMDVVHTIADTADPLAEKIIRVDIIEE